MGKNFTLYIAMHWFQNEHLNLWISKKEMHDASIHHFESYKQVKYGVGVNWRPDWKNNLHCCSSNVYLKYVTLLY